MKDLAALPQVDPGHVDWTRVGRTAYLLHQRFQYDYAEPITDLRHRLVITPPARHADQRRLVRRLRVTPSLGAIRSESVDTFGNAVVDVRVRRVETTIAFEAWFIVERQGPDGVHRESLAALGGRRRWLSPTRLTAPDDRLRDVAATLMASGDTGLALAERINAWVYAHMTYRYGITGVHTDAAAALHLGTGVCQDYAHVMLALARLCGIPARYVSGHLLGEGGTHAWVELLLPDAVHRDCVVVHPFDPTHGRSAGLTYLTVALGRDYRDVAPTSGTYRTGGSGSLDSRKRVDVVRVDYAA
jgi:transglutaminase-like putative cysteine protease